MEASPKTLIAPAHTKFQNGRPTIGYLTVQTSDPITHAVWLGVVEGAREHDVNLFSLAGRHLYSESGEDSQVLYELAKEETVDGLVLFSGSLSAYSSVEKLSRFCGTLSSLANRQY